MRNIFLLIFLLWLPSVLQATEIESEPTEVDNYEDFILKYMPKAQIDFAGALIAKACEKIRGKKQKNKPSNQESILLPNSAAKNIAGKIEISHGNAWVSIYNGNPDWVITDLTVSIKEKINRVNQLRLYHLGDIYVPALGVDRISFDILPLNNDKNFEWAIYLSKGYKLERSILSVQ